MKMDVNGIKKLFFYAIEYRNLECLKYAIENGCEVSDQLYNYTIQKGEWMNSCAYIASRESYDYHSSYFKPYNKKYTYKDCQKYLLSIGYPLPKIKKYIDSSGKISTTDKYMTPELEEIVNEIEKTGKFT